MSFRIKEVCRIKKTPVGVLAKKLGISRTALANQMNGNPTIGSIQRIANILDCKVVELLEAETGFAHVYDENGNYKGLLKS